MINWNEVDTVLLDMDGTLLDLNFDNHFWLVHVPSRYAEKNQINFEQACALIHPHMREIRGTLNWYSIHYWSNHLDLDMLALKSEVSHLVQPRPGVFEMLGAIQHKQTVLATNAHQDTLSVKFSKVPLAPYFDHVVTSHQLGAAKEHYEFWPALKTRVEFNPDRTLLVDDNKSVLEAAAEFGVKFLLTIDQPDLQQPPQAANGYPAISHFDQLTNKIS